MARGGLKSLIPAMNLDTLRGRRKVDPQHKCWGKKNCKKNDAKKGPKTDRKNYAKKHENGAKMDPKRSQNLPKIDEQSIKNRLLTIFNWL